MSLGAANASESPRLRWKRAEDILANDQGLRGSFDNLLERANGWDDDAESRPVMLAARRALARRTNPRLLGYERQLLNALSNPAPYFPGFPPDLEQILVGVEHEAERFRIEVAAAKQDVDCAQRVAADIDRIRAELSETGTNRARRFLLVAPAIAEAFLSFDAARERRRMDSVKRMRDSIRLRIETVRQRLHGLGSISDRGLRPLLEKLDTIDELQRPLERLNLIGAAYALSRIATLGSELDTLVEEVTRKTAASLEQTLTEACAAGWDNALARLEAASAMGSTEIPAEARYLVHNLKRWRVPASSEGEILPTVQALQWLIPALCKHAGVPHGPTSPSRGVDSNLDVTKDLAPGTG